MEYISVDFQLQIMYSQRNVINCRLKKDKTYAWTWTKKLEVQLDKLIDKYQEQCQDLYFLLHFAFVNKVYFLLQEMFFVLM